MPEELQVHRHRVPVRGVWRKGHSRRPAPFTERRLLSSDTCVCAQVWQIRVDVHMLNNDGNLMDASSIAAIAALCHFRRPDVAVQGEEVTVVREQPHQEAEPLHLSVSLIFVLCVSVQSRGEGSHPAEHLPHAH